MSERLIDLLVSSFGKIFLSCLEVTIPLTIISFVLGTLFALLLAIVQIMEIKVLKQIVRIYVWIFRGTPLLVQLFIIFYGMPSIGLTIPAFPAAIIAFSLSVAAYNSEVIRSAILSVPRGQIEAGYMSGLKYSQIMIRIVLPQAAKVAFPNLFNSVIGLTKDTSLASSITVIELFKTAQQIAGRYFEPFALYCEAALVYLLISSLLSLLQSYLEKKAIWKKSDKKIKIKLTGEKI